MTHKNSSLLLLVRLVVDDLPVGALPIQQRLSLIVKQIGSYPASNDYVAIALPIASF
jgi:hypothetical protein